PRRPHGHHRKRNTTNLIYAPRSSPTLTRVVGGLFCQSAVQKADFISALASHHSLHFLALTETWITHENSSTPAALSSAFNFSHSPRQTGRGGGTGQQDLLHLPLRELRRAERKWRRSQLDSDLHTYQAILSRFSAEVTSSSLFSLHSFSWQTCLSDISSWTTAHHLKLNPSKTELLFIPSTTGPHCDLAISLGNSLITPIEDARSLGVILNGQLSFSAHIANLTRSCRFLLYNIRRIRPFLSQEATQLLVQSLVISRLDYCNSLLTGLPLRAIRPLQLNATARLIFNLPKFTQVTPLLRSLHWLPVVARIRFKTLQSQEWTSASLPYGNGEESSCTSSPSCFKYSSSRTTIPEDTWKTSVQTPTEL
ncbi:hypothetical protein NFI96_013030, partial [Prochilodus magdalenae]